MWGVAGEDGCPVDAVGGEVGQGAVRVSERVLLMVNLEAHGRRHAQELFTVGAGVGGHGANDSLTEQVLLVVERGDVGEVDARDGQRPGIVESAESGRHDLACGCEDDGCVEGFGRGLEGVARARAAQLQRKLARCR